MLKVFQFSESLRENELIGRTWNQRKYCFWHLRFITKNLAIDWDEWQLQISSGSSLFQRRVGRSQVLEMTSIWQILLCTLKAFKRSWYQILFQKANVGISKPFFNFQQWKTWKTWWKKMVSKQTVLCWFCSLPLGSILSGSVFIGLHQQPKSWRFTDRNFNSLDSYRQGLYRSVCTITQIINT